MPAARLAPLLSTLPVTPQQPPRTPDADSPPRPGLVLGWGLFTSFALIGLGDRLPARRPVPVLLDMMSP
ncbi:MAG: hypothetical protein IPJ78_19655 [Gemmatimonadetes bacterium]|nr:hypothetical protein [Gemmatimonadota bacterium]